MKTYQVSAEGLRELAHAVIRLTSDLALSRTEQTALGERLRVLGQTIGLAPLMHLRETGEPVAACSLCGDLTPVTDLTPSPLRGRMACDQCVSDSDDAFSIREEP